MSIEKITDHEESAVARLLWQFRNHKVTIPALLQILAARTQTLENLLFSLITEKTLLKTTFNSVLDEYGKPGNLNLTRPLSGPAAFELESYRALLLAEIAANISNGTIEDIFNILKIIGADQIISFDWQPATLQLNYTGIIILNVNSVNEIIVKSTPPINTLISFYTSNAFGFAGDSSAFGFGVGEFGASK